MDDAAHIAEDQPGADQPATPQQRGGTRPVRADRTPGHPQHGHQGQQRGRQQPADLAAELRGEQPRDAGRAAEAAATPAPAADGPGLRAVQAAETVVADGQLQDVVVRRPAEVGPVSGRHQFGGQHPPAAADQDAGPGQQQLPHPPPELRRTRPQVGQREPRHHQERLHHLGQEREAEHDAGQHQPPRAPVLQGPDGGVGGDGEQQHEQGIGVVEPEHQRGDRGQRHDQPGDEPGRGTEPPPDRRVQHGDRGHSFECLRHQQAPVVDAEYPARYLHHPQRGWCFVHGDEVRGVEGAEEERLPALGPGLDRGGVEVVGPPVPAEVDQVQERGQGQQPAHGRADPPRVGVRPAQQPSAVAVGVPGSARVRGRGRRGGQWILPSGWMDGLVAGRCAAVAAACCGRGPPNTHVR